MRTVCATFAALLLLSPVANADCNRRLADHRPVAGQRDIAETWLAEPTDRYRHFVLGANYEAGSLCARLRDGRLLELVLPVSEVFEDRSPRLADLEGDGRDKIVAIRSHVDRGAAVAVIDVRNGRLQIVAATPPTGRPRTWLNIAGIADFTGSGRPSIAAVELPHAVGRLVLWQFETGAMKAVASAANTSNHVIGSSKLGLSAVADFNGDGVVDLAIPSFDRHWLRFLTFKGGVVREFARQRLRARASSNFSVEYTGERRSVVVGLEDGTKQEVLSSGRQK